jgi:hypothetical protein
MLTAIRAVHSIIFLVVLAAIGWLVASGWLGRRDRTVAIATVIVAAETAVYVVNDHVCPLTPMAERYGAVRGSVSDIWLPDAMARTLPVWSSALLVLAGCLHLRSALRERCAGGAIGRWTLPGARPAGERRREPA